MNKLIPAKIGQCHNYCIFLASMHFESIDDFINLEIAVKRFRGNLEKFFYNPISLNEKIRKYFPNLRTQWLYSEEDKIFNDGQIKWYVYWYPMSYRKSLELRKGKEREFKRLQLGKNDIHFVKEKKYKKNNQLEEIIIPNEIKELTEKCFCDCLYLNQIRIPSSITKIGKECFSNCSHLSKVIIEGRIKVIDENCFSNCSNLKEIELPPTLQILSKNAFNNCKNLTEITIPKSILFVDKNTFGKSPYLKSINLE